MKDRRYDSKSINNPRKPLLKLSVAAFLLLAAFCTPARAQIIASDVSSTNLGNGVKIDSVLINRMHFFSLSHSPSTPKAM